MDCDYYTNECFCGNDFGAVEMWILEFFNESNLLVTTYGNGVEACGHVLTSYYLGISQYDIL